LRTAPFSFTAIRDLKRKMKASKRKDKAMVTKKTLHQRERELQSLLATPTGQKELHELACRYLEASDRLRPGRTSVITYILVHEWDKGLISG
jgi:hypothetical protein